MSGSNPPLNKGEHKIGSAMQRIFSAQYHDAMDKQIINTMDFNWVASQEWADEIYKHTHGQIGVFMVNGNKEATKQTGVNLTDFVDRPAVQHALRDETYKFANSVGDSTKDKLRDTLIEATQNGETIDDMTKRIKTVFGFDPKKEIYVPLAAETPAQSAAIMELENWRAERIARTESARAFSTGERVSYEQTGVVEKAVWLAASDACPFCQEMDGKECGFNEPFFAQGGSMTASYKGQLLSMEFNYSDIIGPPLHPNCVVGETPIIAPDRISGFVASYGGPIVEICLSDGRWLSVTPNHMLLTPFGFMPAQFLAEGDDIICGSDLEGVILGNPNNHRLPSRIDDVIKTLSKSSGMRTSSMPMSTEYLHGDSMSCNGKVNIIRPYRFLRDNFIFKKRNKNIQQSILARRNSFGRKRCSHFFGAGSFTQFLHSAAFASDCTMGRRREALAFFTARLRHPERHGFASVPPSNTKTTKTERDSVARTPEMLGKCLDAFAGIVKPKKIRRINIKSQCAFSHVYDLQCLSTMYIINGVLSSNCRCSLTAKLIDIYQ